MRLPLLLLSVFLILAVTSCGTASSAASPGNVAGIVPSKADWPPEGVPGIARKAKDNARKWQPDAVLVAVKAGLLPNTQPGQYIDSPEGKFSLVFTFCSASAQKRITVTPRAPGQEVYEQRGVLCDENAAIPDDFLDLPDAVMEARERGMLSNVPEEAELQNWQPGTSYGGTDLAGLTWVIRGSPYIDHQSFPVPSQPIVYPPVKQVDACALVTPQEASAVLGLPSVNSIPPGPELVRPGVWACIYTATGNQQELVQVTVDEYQFRDRKGYIQRLQQQGWEEVPGVGDSAFAFDSPAGLVTLDALIGETLLEIFISSGNSVGLEEVARLAQEAAQRWKSGVGISEVPPPQEVIVGEWQFEGDGERHLLTIKAKGTWSLAVSDLQTGATIDEKKGYLEWLTGQPGRTVFVSPQGDLPGMESAILLDHDTLEVRARGLTTEQWGRRQ